MALGIWNGIFYIKYFQDTSSMIPMISRFSLDLPSIMTSLEGDRTTLRKTFQCGAPKRCNLVYEPHENYTYKYQKPQEVRSPTLVSAGPTLQEILHHDIVAHTHTVVGFNFDASWMTRILSTRAIGGMASLQVVFIQRKYCILGTLFSFFLDILDA